MYGVISLICGVEIIIDGNRCGPLHVIVRLTKSRMDMAFEWCE